MLRVLRVSVLCAGALVALSGEARALTLVAHWPANGSPADAVGSNDATWVGTPAYGSGNTGQAFDVRSGGVYLSVPEAAAFDFANDDSWTLSVWIYRTSSASTQHILGKRSGCGGGSFYQMAIGPGAIPSASVPLNQWVHAVLTFDESTSTVLHYLDGQLAVTGTHSIGVANDAALLIGRSGSCTEFVGYIDDVRIYDGTLSSAQVSALHGGQSIPGLSGFSAWALVALLTALGVLASRRLIDTAA